MLSLVLILLILTGGHLVILSLLLAPVVSAAGAHKDQVHAVLSRVHEGDGFVVAAPAPNVFAAGKSRVLHTLLVNLEEELGATLT